MVLGDTEGDVKEKEIGREQKWVEREKEERRREFSNEPG